MQPLSAAGTELFHAVRRRFCTQLPAYLADAVPDIPAGLAEALLADTAGDGAAPSVALEAQDWRDLASFAFALRRYETCLPPLRVLVTALSGDGLGGDGAAALDRALLFDKVVRREDWDVVARRYGLAGRAGVEAAMRRALRPLLLASREPVVREEIARYRAAGSGETLS